MMELQVFRQPPDKVPSWLPFNFYQEKISMNIKPFAVEEWMNAYEMGARYNIAETCVDSVSLNELFAITRENREEFLPLCMRESASSTAHSVPMRSC